MIPHIILLLLLTGELYCYEYKTKYFDTKLDHFSFTSNKTFKLKYLINDSFWEDDGPIFFYTGNEGTIESFAENSGFIFEKAPSFNALIIFAEHRYYGSSLPFGNKSYDSLENLGYLSSSQALADYVLLIDHLQSTYNNDNSNKLPVIAFGGSYGGMLAAWLRIKYPFSVIGSIAASAPIWQFQGLTPCENFNIIVTNVYETALPAQDCSQILRKSWKIIRSLASTDAGKKNISKQWNLCAPLNSSSDVDTLVNWLTEIYINMVMVNYPYATSFLVPLPPYPVREFCQKLTAKNIKSDEDLIISLGNALEIYTNYSATAVCNNINQTAPNLGEKGWDFQACTEMIMPMCSTDQDFFENYSWNFTEYANNCAKRWGIEQSNAYLPILEYGGKDLSQASNIVFSNGLLDPWASGGVLSNVSSNIYSVIIPEGAHHIDLRGENPNDPQSVIDARNFHVQTIKNWLVDFYKSRYNDYFKRKFESVEIIKKRQN